MKILWAYYIWDYDLDYVFFYYEHLWDHPKTHHQNGQMNIQICCCAYGEQILRWNDTAVDLIFGIQISGDFLKSLNLPKFRESPIWNSDFRWVASLWSLNSYSKSPRCVDAPHRSTQKSQEYMAPEILDFPHEHDEKAHVLPVDKHGWNYLNGWELTNHIWKQDEIAIGIFHWLNCSIPYMEMI